MKAEKTRIPLTPLALEAWIMLFTLAFGLALLGLIHGRTRALETAAQAQQSLALSLMDAAETLKAELPAMAGDDSPSFTRAFQYGKIAVTARITREKTTAGVLFCLDLVAQDPSGGVETLKTARYFPGEVTP